MQNVDCKQDWRTVAVTVATIRQWCSRLLYMQFSGYYNLRIGCDLKLNLPTVKLGHYVSILGVVLF